MKILDCTLRDGGYYNRWDFSKEFVQEYLLAAESLGIEYIEIGFRLNSNNGFKGACAYSSDSFLKSLNISNKVSIGVMINASEFTCDTVADLDKLFPAESREHLTFVRIAAVKSELPVANALAEHLSSLGYKVFLNLMQMATLSKTEIETICHSISESVEVLYFADSTGSLKPEEVKAFFRIVQSVWEKPLGLHAHDNQSFALINSLTAAENGVEWQDGTFLGMGRGPGNSRTELLWLETQGKEIDFHGLLVGQEFIASRMGQLKETFKWGLDSYYFLAGTKKIHPTFIQNLHEDETLNEFEKISALKFLSRSESFKYNEDLLEDALLPTISEGNWNPRINISQNSFLILANSKSLEEHRIAIQQFIEKEKPYVLALNWNDHIDPNLINAYVSCHPHRVIMSIERAGSLERPLITPRGLLLRDLTFLEKSLDIRNYGVSIKEGTILDKGTFCEIPKLLTIAYALAIASSVRPSKIYLAGLEGKFNRASKIKETEDILRIFASLYPSTSLVSVTDTDYAIESQSIYGF